MAKKKTQEGHEADGGEDENETQTAEQRQHKAEALADYGRGKRIPLKQVRDKKLRANLKKLEQRYTEASVRAKNAEILLEHDAGFIEAETELERTYKVRQGDIVKSVDLETAKKGFELSLEERLGPYVADYTRNGRGLLLAGKRGHVAAMDWRSGKLRCELQLGEGVREARWLHNDQYFAVAQKKYVYIYDHAGVELHCLKKHVDVTKMEFLPYHFLLATAGNSGHLKYLDTSTGTLVSEHPTKLGPPTAMTQNQRNAIIHLGHNNGTVTLWSPNSSTPLVKMLTHRGPVRSLAVDREGRYMLTAGQDCRMTVWDIRQYKEVNNYFLRTPGSSLAISDRNVSAVGWGSHVTFWRGLFDRHADDQEKVQSPYMAWEGEGRRIERLRWCPYEDVLGAAHTRGFTSVLVPGAGEPNFDAREPGSNPYENAQQRRETEVRSLLEKLRPEMIALEPDFIGGLDTASHEARMKERDLDRREKDDGIEKLKNRGRGKNSSLRKILRKKSVKNVIDERREKIEKLRRETNDRTRRKRAVEKKKELGPALARFVRNDR